MNSARRTRSEGNAPQKKMSKEQIILAMKKKKECDAKALMIVEELIECNVNESWLLENLEHINKCHMEDVVEERAILKRCGYVLCDNPLLVSINQRYHISTRNNKVYDVSRRKNFCSNRCYGAANYLLEQMLTCPLWLRDSEKSPNFKILAETSSARTSIPGDEVTFHDENIIGSDIVTENQNSKLDESPSECNSEVRVDSKTEDDVERDRPKNVDEPEQRIIREESDQIISTQPNSSPNLSEEYTVDSSGSKVRTESASTIETDRPSHEDINLKSKDTKIRKKRERKDKNRETFDARAIVGRIERCLEEWMTLDSLSLILGEDAAQRQKRKATEVLRLEKKYAELCRKIDQLQVDEGQDDHDDEERETNLKPLPDYSALKEEGRKLDVKVRAFFKGSTVVETPEKAVADAGDNSDAPSSILPTNDGRDPKILRRRIVMDKLDRVLPELVRTLAGGQYVIDGCIGSNGCGETVKVLANTFSFSATNVIFKPAEWNLMGLIIIKLLSITEPRLRFLLNTDRASKFVTMILMSYNLDPSYLNTLLPLMTDIQARKESLAKLNETVESSSSIN